MMYVQLVTAAPLQYLNNVESHFAYSRKPVGRRQTLDKIQLVENEEQDEPEADREANNVSPTHTDVTDDGLPPGVKDQKLGIRFKIKKKSKSQLLDDSILLHDYNESCSVKR